MNLLERVKKIRELNQIRQRLLAGELGLLERVKQIKELNRLRLELGGVKVIERGNNLNEEGKVNFPELSDDEIKALTKMPIDLTDGMGQGARKKTVAKWIDEHLRNKAVRASDGKLIQFNRNDSIDHISYDSRRNHLRALVVPYIAEVFKYGEAKGSQAPNHEHQDTNIIAFHAYQKWVTLKNHYQVLLEVQAVERSVGIFEFAAYTHKILQKKSDNTSYTVDSANTAYTTRVLERLPDSLNHTVIYDRLQVEAGIEVELVRILQIIDPKGNDVTESYAESSHETVLGHVKVADLYAFDDRKTQSERQRDNYAVFELLDRVERGELLPEYITSEQKAILAKYSGSGGGLKARDGKTGSAHEYYTPAPVAQAMWQAIEEMGFTGGKVLDPCGGSGIFGAFAPESAIVQAVEMDETSATVNRLINGSDRYHVDVASFEERAQSIPDI